MSPKDTAEPDPLPNELTNARPDDPLDGPIDGRIDGVVPSPFVHLSVDALTARVEQLEEALASHAVVDQARGVLMAAHRIDAGAAWSLLVRVSSHENIKIRALAESVVALVTEPPASPPDQPSTAALRYLLPRGWWDGSKPG